MQDFVTAAELASVLKVSRRWIHEQTRTGGLPHHYLGDSGRVLRFSLGEVQDWIKSSDPARSSNSGRSDRDG